MFYCVDKCDFNNNNCEQMCIKGKPPKCACDKGYKLAADRHKCEGKYIILFVL